MSGISKEMQMWNYFVSFVVNKELKDMTTKQQSIARVFWYYSEVNNGGHSNFFENYPEITNDDLIDALNSIEAEKYADNFSLVINNGKDDEYTKADEFFQSYIPSLEELLQKYVIKKFTDIFGNNVNL